MTLRLSLAQINPTVGDLAANAAKILEFARRAEKESADLLLFPEMALTGYPPEDLLFYASFLKDAERALRKLAGELPRNLTVVLGAVRPAPRGAWNAAAVVQGGVLRGFYHKQCLPNYGIFDEKRYFIAGKEPLFLKLGPHLAAATICEDIWVDDGPLTALAGKASLILNISASPYHAEKPSQRAALVKKRAKACGSAFAYCNMVGGQDELVFDGASFVADARGRVIAQAAQFEEALTTIDLPLPIARKTPRGALVLPLSPAPRLPLPKPPPLAFPLPALEEIYSALVLGTRDYARKNKFKQAVVGLSGGIDSCLVAAIAADALGPDSVAGVTLPSRFNSEETKSDAETLAKNIGLRFESIPIESVVEEFLKALAPLFSGRPRDLTEENLQSRVRGVILMALSNKFGWLVLTTGNKSETSVGYSTLYGDTAGGFAPIKDIPKKMVYDLCRLVNRKAGKEVVPQSVFDRPPSAELKPGQKDQDTLPPYDVLDKIIRLYVEEDKGLPELIRSNLPKTEARRVMRMVDASEYKRRQAPPGVKITPKAFGRDRRMPITNGYVPNL